MRKPRKRVKNRHPFRYIVGEWYKGAHKGLQILYAEMHPKHKKPL